METGDNGGMTTVADPVTASLDSQSQWSQRYETRLGKGGDLVACHEWHAAYADLRPLFQPHLERVAIRADKQQVRILDVGCGTSLLGLALLEELPHAELTLVDVEPLVSALQKQHETDVRIRVIADDSRSLSKVEDQSVTVVIDKGTLDAMEHEEEAACFHAMLRTLQRPHGVLLSVSFLTSRRVLMLRREAEQLGFELRFRVVRGDSGLRLVAFLSFCFDDAGDVIDDFTEQQLDRLLFNGPLWDENFVNFEHPALPARLVLEQMPRKDIETRSNPSGYDATGFFVWPASRALAAHLIAHPEIVQGKRVVELGAGAGLVGLVAAALGASEVVLTELAGTIPLLERNVQRNEVCCGGRARAIELFWGAETGPGGELANFDVIIGCELIYRLGAETYTALVASMAKLAGVHGICLFVIECRDGMVDDIEFFDRVNEVFDAEATSLAPYGYGLQRDGSDDDERLLYTYRPYHKKNPDIV